MLGKGCQADVVFSLVFGLKASSLWSQLGDCPAPIRVRVLSQRWASPGQSALTDSEAEAGTLPLLGMLIELNIIHPQNTSFSKEWMLLQRAKFRTTCLYNSNENTCDAMIRSLFSPHGIFSPDPLPVPKWTSRKSDSHSQSTRRS